MTDADTRSAATLPGSGDHAQPTILGLSCHIRGELVIDGDAVILGAVDGDIEAEGTLQIGPNGKVTGRVRAAAVAVEGSIKGPVETDGPVELTGTIEGDVVAGEVAFGATGKLLGNLRARVLSIEEGATYRGEVIIGPDAFEQTPARTAAPAREAEPPSPAEVQVNGTRPAVGSLLRRRHELLGKGA